MKHRSNDVGRFALHAVAFAAACFWVGEASALGLGRLSVTSALGESLKAEVDVSSITPEEASSLTVKVATPEAYRAAGVEYNNVLPSARVQLLRRPDGRSYLRLTSDRAVLEPFVDVIIEATWSTGRLVREYTMLFDPPGSRMAQAPVPSAAPVMTPPPARAPVARPAVTAAPGTPPAEATREAPTRRAPPAVAAGDAPDSVRVKSGDTLFGIAARTQRPGISLDQMLVSLFRGNPKAFIDNNMNRMKAGAVLTVPTVDQAAAVSTPQAREVIVAQSADFDAYRRRLAGNVAPAAQASPNREASGKVQAQVEDRKQAAAATPDRLTLSQGAKASAAEASVSRASAERDSKARLAELARNVEDLKKLQSSATPGGTSVTPPAGASPTSVPGAGPTVVAAAPAAAVVAAATATASAPVAEPVVAPVAEPALASASAPAMPSPAASVAARPAPPAVVRPESPSMLDSLLANPLVLPGAGLLVLLLLGYGVWRMRTRSRSEAGETSFLESRLQPDSFFGASGGQRVDTRDAAATSTNASSMNYSLSQLDAIGDVDPVAEADVYLAYGRDLQAEEILKEAMRSAPERMAVRSKLLEVYAKRRDLKSYELLATQMYNLTHGEGPEWTQAQELGLTIDPENALYQAGGQPEAVRDAQGQVVNEPLGASTMPFTAPVGLPAFQPAADATLDRPDLDLELGPTTIPGAPVPPPVDDLTLPFASPPRAPQVPQVPAAAATADEGSIDFDLSELDTLTPITQDQAPAAEPLLDFGELNAGDAAPGMDELGGPEPMARKLELAEEFRQIGDIEGARDLLEEVVSRSEGSLKAKAQGMLDQLE